MGQAIELPFTFIKDYSVSNNNERAFASFMEQSPLLINEDFNYIVHTIIGEEIISMRLSTIYSWVEVFERANDHKGYHPQISKTFEIIQEIKNRDNTMILVRDSFHIKDFQISMKNYQFYLIPHSISHSNIYDGTIGLNIRENGEDFLTDLVQKGVIQKQIMSITHISEGAGLLSFGDIPKANEFNRKLYKTCLLDEGLQDNKWNCKLYGVYLDNGKFFSSNGHLRIGLGSNLIYVPRNVYTYLVNSLFEEDIDANNCVDNGDQVCCNENYNGDKLGHISYILGKWTLKLNLGQIFRMNKNKCLSIANSHSRVWLISPSVMISYKIVYNKEEKNLGFHKTNLG